MTSTEPPATQPRAATAENAAAMIRARLGTLHRELQSRKFLLRALLLLGAAGVLWLLLSGTDLVASWQERAAFSAATVLSVAVLLVLAFLAVRLLARRQGSLAEIALRMENQHPELRDALICATELSRKEPGQLQRVERALLESIPASIEGMDLRQSALSSNLRLRRLVPAGLACVLLLVAALFTPLTQKALYFARDLSGGASSGLTVRPGSQEVPRFTDVGIRAEIQRWQKSAVIEYLDSEGPHVFPLFERAEGHLGFTIYGVEEPIRYRIKTPSLTSEWYDLDPYDPPSIESRKIRVEPPAYTALEPVDHAEFTDLTVVEGSRVKVSVTTGKGPQPDVSFHLEGENPATGAFESLGEREYTYDHQAEHSGDFHVSLSGVKDRLTRTDSHKLTVIPDQPPAIEIIEPGRDLQAGPEEELNIVAKAVDDFGLGDVVLNMTVIGRDPMVGSVLSKADAQKTPKERVVSVPTPLTELRVDDGDIISYFFTTKDNKEPDAQEARTEIFFIEIVRAKTPERMDGMPGQQQQQMEVRSLIEGLKKNIRQNLALQTRETNGEAASEEYQSLEAHMAELRTSGQKKLKEIVDFMGMTEESELLDRFTNAVNLMEASEKLLGDKALANAVPPAQTAMRELLQVEQELIQNTMNQQASESQASNLGEQNQPPKPPERQQSPEEIRKELQSMAQDIEKLAREQARLNQQMSQAARGGSAVSGQQQERMQEKQNELGQRTAETSQRMEKFADADQMNQGLKQAGQEMKQSSETLGEGDAAAAQAYGERARDELSAVADSLNSILQQQGQQRAAQAAQQAQGLAEAQSQQAQASRQAGASGAKGAEATKQSEALRDEQADLKEQYEKLRSEMQGLASEMESQSPAAARKMAEAARQASDKGTGGTMEKASNALLYQRMERAAQLQDQAAGDLRELAETLAEAASAPSQISDEAMAQAMADLQKSQARMEALRAEAGEQAQAAKGESGKEGEPGNSQETAQKLSEEVGKVRGMTGKNLEGLGERMQDQAFTELGRDLQAPEGEGGKSPEATLALANETLQSLDMAMQLLRDRMLISNTRDQARLNVESVPPPEKYRRLVEEYFKRLGSGEENE